MKLSIPLAQELWNSRFKSYSWGFGMQTSNASSERLFHSRTWTFLMSRLLLHRSSLCMYISNFTSTSFSIGWAHLFLIIFLCMPITICSKLATIHSSHADTDAAFACWVALLIKISFPLAQPIQGCERPVCTSLLLWHWRFVCKFQVSLVQFLNWVSTTPAQPIALGTLAITFSWYSSLLQ